MAGAQLTVMGTIKVKGGVMASNTKKRGFAAMSKEERTRIARMGGKASHGSRKRI